MSKKCQWPVSARPSGVHPRNPYRCREGAMKPSMRPPPALIAGWTVAEAAQYLATTPEQIYQLVSARRIPYRKIGTNLLFRREALDA